MTVTIGTATQPDGDLGRALHDAGLAAYAAKVDRATQPGGRELTLGIRRPAYD